MANGTTIAVTEDRSLDVIRNGWLAIIGSAVSITACYLYKITSLLLPVVGFSAIQLNPHVQAVVMWSFALLAVYGLARNRTVHRRNTPFVIGVVAFAIIIGTLYTHYEVYIETLGYVLLVVAAFLNQNVLLGHLNRVVEAQAREVTQLNRSLERRVSEQVGEIERLARLKRFLAPEIADLITAEGRQNLLDSHRSFIACLFCDIRDFTALSEGIEPEEVMNVLQAYHEDLGGLVRRYGATIGFRSGDGLMVFLNDPIACDDPVRSAVDLARDMVAAFNDRRLDWQRLGYQIGFGVGVAGGYATLGLVGDEGRSDYTAIGNVVNLAARLCETAGDGEILINRRVYADIGEDEAVAVEGGLELKGFDKPVEVFRLV